jgi:phosphoenolpyruvate carboxykinase (GTP)
MRVLKWIVERCQGRAHAVETVLGLQPEYGDLEWSGLDFSAARFDQVMCVDRDSWQRELAAHDRLFAKLGTKQPQVLADLRRTLGSQLAS